MRFLTSRCRTAAEILLTLAVLAYVTYDLVDRSGGKAAAPAEPRPASSSAAAPSAAQPSASAAALALNKVPAARFEALMDPTIAKNNTFTVCGPTPAPANPWQIGGTANRQALVFLSTATSCKATPAVMGSNNLSYAGVWVRPASWLSLQNLLPNGIAVTGAVGSLAMDQGSYLEAVVPDGFVGAPFLVQNFQLLKAGGACPAFTGVNFTVTNCISDASLSKVGAYACYLTSTTGTTCTISLTIVGAMSAQASNYIQATLGWDCSTMTQALFKQTIALYTGVPVAAILVTYWQCGSIAVFFTVLGGTVAQANVALNTIYVSMATGSLNSALQVISVSVTILANPRANGTYTTSTIAYPYSYPYVLPYLVPYSQSNPGLLALLTLLLIPVALALALLLWCACRPVKKPVPPPCPCPCAAPYMPLPTCMPAPCPPPVVCEPMCAPLMPSGSMLGSPAGGCPAF